MNGVNENVDISSINDYLPSSAQSFHDFSGLAEGGNNLGDRIGNFFGGYVDRKKQDYDIYLQNLNTENAWKLHELDYQRELKAVQDARNWDKMMSDTQYQRMVDDIKKAGLNPWLAVNSGGLSGASVGSSAKANINSGSLGKYQSQKEQKSSGMRDASLLLFAIARLLAA